MNKPIAYSYLRFSTPEQAQGDSLRRQLELAENYALKNGLQLMEASFHDLGVSAFRSTNAETGKLAQFLACCHEGSILPGSWLLIESMDRLSRAQPRKALKLLESICEAGITVVTLNDEKIYSEESLNSDPFCFMQAFFVAIRANEESLTKSRRLKAAWTAKRAQASQVKMTSKCPSWLRLSDDRKSFEVILDKAKIVAEIWASRANGCSTYHILKQLNCERIPTLSNKSTWCRSSVVKILASDSVIGTLTPSTIEYRNNRRLRRPCSPIEGYFPPIVTKEIWAAVRALEAFPSQRGRHTTGHTMANILGGICKCAKCGSSMTLVSKGSSWKKLVCIAAKNGGKCVYRPVDYPSLEATLTGGAASWVPSPSLLLTAFVKGDDKQKTAFIISQAHKILADTVRGNLSSKLLQGELQKLDSQAVLEEARLAKSGYTRTLLNPGFLTTRIEKLKLALKSPSLDRAEINRLLKLSLDCVTIDPEAADGVVAHWKNGMSSYLPISTGHQSPSEAPTVGFRVSGQVGYPRL